MTSLVTNLKRHCMKFTILLRKRILILLKINCDFQKFSSYYETVLNFPNLS